MSLRLLLVEDEDTQREIYSTYLKECEYYVDTAPDTVTAIELMDNNSYDIIITDKNLPGLNESNDLGGMEVLEYAQKKYPNTELIMMTGYATVQSAIEAMKLGAFDYITKPFEMNELNRVIKRLSEYKSFINPENTIDIYKKLHNEVIDLISTVTMDDTQRKEILKRLDKRIDLFFEKQKIWEGVIVKQREALSSIAGLIQRLSDNLNGSITDEVQLLIKQIMNESNKKI